MELACGCPKSKHTGPGCPVWRSGPTFERILHIQDHYMIDHANKFGMGVGVMFYANEDGIRAVLEPLEDRLLVKNTFQKNDFSPLLPPNGTIS